MSRANRRHARWPIAAALTLAAIAALCAARPAGAAVTLGQLAPTSPTPECSSNADYLQPSITGGNLYIARQAGTITSWSTRSSGAGATYVFKVLRRTSDPDIFRVIAHAPAHELTSGVNTVPVNIAVRSGDMIGLNESGGLNSCTFSQLGDGVLTRGGSLSDGASGQFGPQNDVRLNLSAVLVPSNAFTISSITRNRKQGTATVLVNVSNPGMLTISGRGLKKRPSKNIAVAGTAQFQIASVGKRKRKLEKTGKLTLTPTLTFSPAGGDPASQTFAVKLRKRRPAPIALGSPNAH
ncbi:MAG TPA: hypothetical protein VLB79_02475 [Solirubrobacterales bacterium]|nr:hypothetical protein [Solirubrobacterales bacterium]